VTLPQLAARVKTLLDDLGAADAPYYETVLALGPVGYWRLGDAGATAVDEMGVNNGSFAGSPTKGVTGAIAGDTNKAITLAGSPAKVSINDNNALDLGDTFTINAWISKAGSGNRGIVCKGAGAYYLRLNTADTISLLKDGTAMLATSTGTVGAGWHMVTATKATTAVHVYIDGVDLTDNPVTATACVDTATALDFGRDISGDAEYFVGSLDEITLWNRALTVAEVLSLYEAGA
jgi:hypothetical protein